MSPRVSHCECNMAIMWMGYSGWITPRNSRDNMDIKKGQHGDHLSRTLDLRWDKKGKHLYMTGYDGDRVWYHRATWYLHLEISHMNTFQEFNSQCRDCSIKRWDLTKKTMDAMHPWISSTRCSVKPMHGGVCKKIDPLFSSRILLRWCPQTL